MFFALVIGSLSLGNALPEIETFATALGAASAVYDIIDKVCVDWVVCGCGLGECGVWVWCVGGVCVVCRCVVCGCGLCGVWCVGVACVECVWC